MKHVFRYIPAVVFLAAITAYAGGWATVTVRHIPEYFVVGKAVTFNFVVRQHGATLLEGIVPEVQAVSNNRVIEGRVVSAANKKGEYTARITFPAPGNWTMRIASGWNASAATLMPVQAIPEGSTPPAPLNDVARGERLFVSKACITCHVNKEITIENSLSVGPELTGRTFAEEYLQKLLSDSASVGKKMPNQELANEEIRSLTAFMNRKR